MRRREDPQGSSRCIPAMPSICGLLSLPPPSPRYPPTQQYQVGGEAQVGSSQQSYKAEVGRVGKAGHIADDKVKVDSADQHHDGGSDDFAHPWE